MWFKVLVYRIHVQLNLPSLLDIKESDPFIVFEEEVASPGIKYGVTRRTLDLLGDLITKVLDHKLQSMYSAKQYQCVV